MPMSSVSAPTASQPYARNRIQPPRPSSFIAVQFASMLAHYRVLTYQPGLALSPGIGPPVVTGEMWTLPSGGLRTAYREDLVRFPPLDGCP